MNIGDSEGRINMRRFFGIFVLMLIFILVLSACSGDGKESLEDEGGNADGKTNITFWHSMSGDNGDELEAIADKFNEQSDSVHVEPIFYGSYEYSLTQLRLVRESEEVPVRVHL